MKRVALREIAFAFVLIGSLVISPAAFARGPSIDPDGLSFWQQIWSWLTNADVESGPFVDPNG